MGFVTQIKDFESARKKALDTAASKSNGYNDERLIKFEIGNKYRFRLIYYIDADSNLDEPFIRKWTHSAQNAEAKWKTITCPTTHHQGSAGYAMCKTCDNNNKLWNSGIESDKVTYKKFRRRFNGYALVYVVKDGTNSDNNGQIKIMRFGVKVDKFLQKQIFGIADGSEDSVEFDTVGFDAFKFENGFDLQIEVQQQGEWPDYLCEFARKSSTIDIDMSDAEDTIKELKFIEEFKEDDKKSVDDFFKECVLQYDDDENDNSGDDDSIQIDGKSETKSETKAEDKSYDDILNEMSNDNSEDVKDDGVTEVTSTDTEIDDLLAELNM